MPLRNNLDKVIDNHGHKLISLCKSTNHVIANGRFKNDKIGQYTFTPLRGLSVTDYLLVNINCVQLVHDFSILNWNNFSDHAAIHFSFKLNEYAINNKIAIQKITQKLN